MFYTVGLGISVYLDRIDFSRSANDPTTHSLGAVLKPVLLSCLCTIIVISLFVFAISEYAKLQGVL